MSTVWAMNAEELFGAIEDSGSLPVGVEADEAAAAVLCSVLARMELQPARALLDALGDELVQVIGRCPIHEGQPGESFDEPQLLARIASHFELAPEAVRPMTAAVLSAIRQRVARETGAQVERQLPTPILELWRGAGAP
ncbi:MAG TPA: DUF2267 domain-containing protein [Polyangia bacterium]|nr:DUF2267 domain-containing protein [Polyangia bacterium]